MKIQRRRIDARSPRFYRGVAGTSNNDGVLGQRGGYSSVGGLDWLTRRCLFERLWYVVIVNTSTQVVKKQNSTAPESLRGDVLHASES